MTHFPVFMDLREEPVLVVGGGGVAERKIRLLLRASARVQVAARQLNATLRAWQADGRIDWLGHEYHPGQLEAVRLVFAASDNRELNRAVHADAEARRIPVNCVDDIEHCRFITPAIVDRAPIQVAISSGGASPVLARRIRAWIERLLPEGLGRVARAAGQLRSEAARLPLPRRRAFWDRLLTRSTIQSWARRPVKAIRDDLRRALASEDQRTVAGRVILVGAGPGRADLLTVRAQQVLGQADVILHDRLVPEAVLDVARRDAERIDVGKRAGDHHVTQERIQELLVEYARRGLLVVRLKGGDPFVFGRGGEELEYLKEHGVPYEVVPGLTAATACAAFAGIPLTHRDHAQALTLITGHTQDGGPPPPWRELAGPGRTLAIYMGVSQAASLRGQLLDAGLPGDLPAALVSDGARDSQQTSYGDIDGLPALAARAPRGAPGLFIIGDVAALGQRLAWFEAEESLRDAA